MASFDPTMIAAITITAFAFAYFQWRSLRWNSRIGYGVAGLRFLLVALLVTILFDPTQLKEKRIGEKETFDLIIDDSESVTHYYANEKEYREDLRRFFKSPMYKRLQEQFRIRTHLMSQAQVTVSHEDLLRKKLHLSASSMLIDALKKVGDDYRQRQKKPAGVLVISDGQDTVNRDPNQAVKILRSYGFPVNSAVFSLSKRNRDLVIRSVKRDPVLFAGVKTRVEAMLYNRGFDSVRLPISVTREGHIIATKTVQLETGKATRVSFDITLADPGDFFLKISVPPLQGEANLQNNSATIGMQVRKNNIRVLHIAGNPSWDTKFLRLALKQDPTVDLVSFYILREHEDVNEIPTKELSLIQFPHDRLFGDEISNFDLVIIQNFQLKKFLFPYYYINNIGDYVRNGGRLFVMGGPKAFIDTDFSGTRLETVMPFRLRRKNWDERKFNISVSDYGHASVFGRSFLTPNPQFLKDIVGGVVFDGFNRVGTFDNRAHVILHAQARDSKKYPLLVEQRVDKGRVLTLLTNSFWKMRFYKNDSRGVGLMHQRFIRYLFEWMLDHDDIRPVRFSFKTEIGNGSVPTKLAVIINEQVNRYLSTACPCTLAYDIMGASRKIEISPTTDRSVTWVEVPGLGSGQHRVGVTLKTNTGEAFATEATLFIDPVRDELRYSSPFHALMRRLSEETGGAAVAFDPVGWQKKDALIWGNGNGQQIVHKYAVSTWHTPWMFVCILLLMSLEWVLRKVFE